MKKVLALCVLAVSLTLASCSDGSFVDKVAITNPTEYPATVDVHGTGQGSTDLATVVADSEMTIHDVYDQGDRWIFRFTYSGYRQELELSRDQLAHDGWRVMIPSSFETHLRTRGVQPPREHERNER
ncbi:MAG: hypothetical protein QOH48_1730 [Actinomycetota bacterium]|nr:hypothetical protein [Actinomycetota bacterium]